jgi:osmotically-inducible protein OsmY
MKKMFAAVSLSFLLVGAFGCANWNRATPKSMDNTAIEEEVRKNMAADGITGMSIDVSNGVVTLKGDVQNATQHQQAVNDARKVDGVTRVIDEISVKP